MSINGYTDEGEAHKKHFLRDGRTYLLAVAKAINPHGFASLGVHANPAGVAVSGDVWFKAWSESLQQGVSVNLSEIHLTVERADRLTLLANELSQRVVRGKGKQAHVDFKSGPNVWLSANLDSDDLVQQLLKMLRIQIPAEMTPVKGQPGQLTLFDEIPSEMSGSYPELDIWLSDGISADHIVQITIQGAPLVVRPQMERLLSGLTGWGAYETHDGLEVMLNVHPKTLSGLWARIQAQNNWLGANGRLPNVEMRYGSSHETLCEAYLGLNLWHAHEPLTRHEAVGA
ncbi:MAG: hypothetical protein HC853_00165 [Anaerolineae bacterium]|nr:hypothetical protein [Anaerolineae bacterium]